MSIRSDDVEKAKKQRWMFYSITCMAHVMGCLGPLDGATRNHILATS